MPPKQTTVGMLGIPSLFGGTPEMVMAYTIWQAMCGNGVMMRMKVMQILVCCAVALGLILRGSCGSPKKARGWSTRMFTSSYIGFRCAKD